MPNTEDPNPGSQGLQDSASDSFSSLFFGLVFCRFGGSLLPFLAEVLVQLIVQLGLGMFGISQGIGI